MRKLLVIAAVIFAAANMAMASPADTDVIKERTIFPETMFASDHDIVTVAIKINPPPETRAYAVEEDIPEGVMVALISDGGNFDNVNRKVKFGPFLDNQERLLIYHIDPMSKYGEIVLKGKVSFDGGLIDITGADKFKVIEGSSIEGTYIDEMRFRDKLRDIGQNFWELSDLIGNSRER